MFVSRTPRPPLDRFVSSLWFYQSPPQQHLLERILPSGTAQLIVNLKEDETRIYEPGLNGVCLSAISGSILSGVQSRYSLIDTAEQECVLGVVFLPGGTAPFFRVPAPETRDCDVPLNTLWGRSYVACFREQLLEAATPVAKLQIAEKALLHFFEPLSAHAAVAFALDEFINSPDRSVSSVINQIGLSPKRFIERFERDVGVLPKQFCRIRRFQRALAMAEKSTRVDWTRVTMDCGYFDQAHFIREFRGFAGITPTEYEAARTQYRNHVKFIQSNRSAA